MRYMIDIYIDFIAPCISLLTYLLTYINSRLTLTLTWIGALFSVLALKANVGTSGVYLCVLVADVLQMVHGRHERRGSQEIADEKRPWFSASWRCISCATEWKKSWWLVADRQVLYIHLCWCFNYEFLNRYVSLHPCLKVLGFFSVQISRLWRFSEIICSTWKSL